MTSSAPVRVRERMFWCRADALAVWLAHAVEEIRVVGDAPEWLQALEQDWAVAAGFPDFGLHWDPESDHDLALMAGVCGAALLRARAAGDLTAERLCRWEILDGMTVAGGNDGHPVEVDRVLEVGAGFRGLFDGTFPADPPGRHWFLGTGEGPQPTDR
jgi:hypothetical protein